MKTAMAEVFWSGKAQALRLPETFRLRSETVTLVKTRDGFRVKDHAPSARRIKAFAALAGSCPGFPKIRGNSARSITRDWE